MSATGPHEAYLQALKEWLRKTRLPGDRVKLRQSLQLLREFNVKVTEGERREIRDLLSTTFDVPAAECVALLPDEGDTGAPVQGRDERVDLPLVQGYVKDYVGLTGDQESPASFHAFALLTCVGAALGRRVWMDMTWFKVWPNLSVVLTGPAGGPRKTTAWDMALATVKEGFGGWKTKQISDASPQALVEELANAGRSAVGFIYAPEFRHFFPSQNYMEGAVPLITRLLDNPDHYPVARITRKAATLRNVTLSMAGGSTLDWMAKLPQDAQGGGFLTRVIIVHEESAKKPSHMPERAKAEVAGRVRAALAEIARYGRGEMRLGAEARGWYKEWYEGLKVWKGMSPRLVLYYNRKQTHLLRIAMLMSLPKKVLGVKEMEAAKAILDWVEVPLADVYRVIGMSKTGEMTRAVLDALKAMGGKSSYAMLMREMKGLLNKRDFQMAIDTLKEAGQLKETDNVVEHSVQIRDLSPVE